MVWKCFVCQKIVRYCYKKVSIVRLLIFTLILTGICAASMGVQTNVQIDKLSNAWELYKKSAATNINNLVKVGLPNVPYYSLKIANKVLAGERPWDVRWNIIKAAGVDFNDKQILEVGCNMGLLSTFLLVDFKPRKVVGFDRDAIAVKCAQLIAEAFDVKPILHQLFLIQKNTQEWQKILGFGYDVVFLLSVFKYFNPAVQLDFMTFLQKNSFPVLIYEGDKFLEKELTIFKNAGYTRQLFIGKSDRGRPMFVLHHLKNK